MISGAVFRGKLTNHLSNCVDIALKDALALTQVKTHITTLAERFCASIARLYQSIAIIAVVIVSAAGLKRT